MKVKAIWKPTLIALSLLLLSMVGLFFAPQEPCLLVLLLYFSGIGGLVVFTRSLASQELLRRGFIMGFCIVSLMIFATLEWWGWGLYAMWGWDKGIFLLYGVCAFAGMGSGQLLYRGATKCRAAETAEERSDGSVLQFLGLVVWTMAFVIVSAANIWWATI